MIKGVFCSLIFLFSSSVFAQDKYDDLVPGYCSPMSKNSICWEEQDNTRNPRPTPCLTRYACSVVQTVEQDSWGYFHCKGNNGQTFSCDDLVEKFGGNLYGLVVKVSTPYVDGCHVLGACGPRACVPNYGAASLDESCQ